MESRSGESEKAKWWLRQAQRWIWRALQLDSRNPRYWTYLAWAEDELGFTRDAAGHLLEAVTLSPDDQLAQFNLTCALSKILQAEKDQKEREKIADQALMHLRKIPESSEVWEGADTDPDLKGLRDTNSEAKELIGTMARKANEAARKRRSSGA